MPESDICIGATLRTLRVLQAVRIKPDSHSRHIASGFQIPDRLTPMEGSAMNTEPGCSNGARAARRSWQ
ncbi:hypothetical protein XHV734_3853 [Xanthomonas hortorum pv. vitians]|nr:hypothetical protein XHV734_3853 [Xanthomonas hortorum pv. vitians]